MTGIIKVEQLPEKEKIFLKKSFIGWHVVHPLKNEDGTVNWFNVFTGGSWWNVVFAFAVVILFLGIIYEYSANIKSFQSCFNSPQQLEQCKKIYGNGNTEINLTKFISPFAFNNASGKITTSLDGLNTP